VLPQVVMVRSAGKVTPVPLEDYVAAAVLSEVSPTSESDETVARILQVQAVVARTYAVFELGRHKADGFDLCDSTHCQLYEPARLRTSRFAQSARAAAARTAGRVLTYQGRAAETLFHADCGGYTAAANSVWGGLPVPYLLPAPDEVGGLTHRTWQLTVPAEKLRLALNADPRTRVGKKLTSVEVRDRDVSGRATGVLLGGELSPTVRGEDLRAVVGQALGDRAFMSTRFAVRRTGTDYVFNGTGFGHGVGLCQIGAAARARRGESVDSILAHYFPAAVLR
jgi:stage II sporulation protein D